jgi:hypothetical protein
MRLLTACLLALASLSGLLVGCNGDGSSTVPSDLPTCPAAAAPGAACQGDQLCMGCSQGALYTCGCTDAGADDGGGTRWLCVGAEQECP